ncbi:GTP-binding protein [Microbacterium sp. APC 3898]|uniref:GTP-binding protein n=1 Tax=Planococcus notacanthi TaxID=3035188 RepID=A0ABT7ZGX2_9BACL|nr:MULTISPECIES: GTP-binding protein [Terrabacteria group]MBF6632460.1 GTP-binding protein [Planococcus sp. (in: firmicutes)]MDN3426408.1 GTP-binding protein [Planococcus sp. APC 4016]MDN3498104.1 GTP-binding protein [Microbacterium sp. APC 3898]
MKDVYLFSGFLGSGKTTLLKGMITQMKDKGLKPAVFMNELGKMNMDSDSVEDGVPLKEILDGCICCSGSEKSEAQIQTLLAEEDFDVLLIETTGAAHPVEALDAIFSPLFADQLNFKGIVTVADSKRWMDRNSLSPQIRSLFLEQIRHADLILANKMDLLTDGEQGTVVYEIQSLNPTAQIIQTVHAKVPFSALDKMTPSRSEDVTKTPVSKLNLNAKVLQFDAPVQREKFEDWLRALPDTVFRIKGYVPLEGDKYPHAFQFAYGMAQWLPEYIKMQNQIVVIGEGLEGVELP